MPAPIPEWYKDMKSMEGEIRALRQELKEKVGVYCKVCSKPAKILIVDFKNDKVAGVYCSDECICKEYTGENYDY